MKPQEPTLAALLSVLAPEARLFVVHRTGPHECEAVAEGTAEELRANGRIDVCGNCPLVGLSLELDNLTDAPAPVLLVTIREREKELQYD